MKYFQEMINKQEKVKLLKLLQAGEISVPEFKTILAANGEAIAAVQVDNAYLVIDLPDGSHMVNDKFLTPVDYNLLLETAWLIIHMPDNGRDFMPA
jgi:hypothetical protein